MSVLSRPPTAILFDAVGTLMYADPPVADVYQAQGRRFQSRLSRQTIQVRFQAAVVRHHLATAVTSEADQRVRWQRIVRDVFDDVAEDDQGALFDGLWIHFAKATHWRLFDDVAAVWKAFQGRGCLLAVASNFDARLESICRGLEPLESAHRVYHSAGVGFAKPAEAFFRHIAADLQLDPDQILMIGDDYTNDYRAAKLAGWHAIHLARNGGRQPAPEQITKLHQLLD